jgi:hypothetical protein
MDFMVLCMPMTIFMIVSMYGSVMSIPRLHLCILEKGPLKSTINGNLNARIIFVISNFRTKPFLSLKIWK